MKKSELRHIIREEIHKVLNKTNPINKFFNDLANEGEELVKKMNERKVYISENINKNGNLQNISY